MKRVLKISLAATFFGQMAFAQSPPPAVDSGGSAVPAPADVNLSAPNRAQLSPAEMVQQSQDYKLRITETQNKLNALVEAARKDKDIIRLNCLLDKVAQVRANGAVADQASAALQDAAARNDEAASVHEFTRLTIVNQKVQLVATEAEACVGEDLTFVGQTRVDVEYNGAAPPSDLTQPPPPVGTLDRPPPSSPFM